MAYSLFSMFLSVESQAPFWLLAFLGLVRYSSMNSGFWSALSDISKAGLFASSRFVYLCLFHPLAHFPGPLLAKAGDVRTMS